MRFFNTIFMILIALTVSVAMKIVGALLIGALMVIPVITAMQITKGFKTSVYISILFALTSVLIGLFASYYLNLPAGAAIVMTSILIFSIVSILRRI